MENSQVVGEGMLLMSAKLCELVGAPGIPSPMETNLSKKVTRNDSKSIKPVTFELSRRQRSDQKSLIPQTSSSSQSSSDSQIKISRRSSSEESPFQRTRGRLSTLNEKSSPINPSEFEGLPFDGFISDDLNAMVKAYVTRKFTEELDLISELTMYEGSDHLLAALRSSYDYGLTDSDELMKLRKGVFNINCNPIRRPTPFWRLVYLASRDFILRILMVAGLVSLILGLAFGERKEIEWIEGAAIFLAVTIVLFVTATNDWIKERQFAALCEKDEKFASVRRNGSVSELKVEDLLVGDIILIETGDELPTDCLVLTSNDLVLDESAMTGESMSIKKASLEECIAMRRKLKAGGRISEEDHHAVPSPIMLSGCSVTSGSGVLLVLAVGPNSRSGDLLRKLTVDTEATPLQNKLNALARDIGNLGFAASLVTLFVLIIQFWILYAIGSPVIDAMDAGAVVAAHVEFLVQAITIIVVAVPEGLPLAVTLSLAFSVGRMLKDQNYVRRLAACETMGGANEICSDKTGTLTKNRMALHAFWNGSKLSELDARASLPDMAEESLIGDSLTANASFGSPHLPQPYFDIFLECIAVNSTAYLEKEDKAEVLPGSHAIHIIKHVGSPTECALLQFIQDMGYDYTKIRNEKGGKDSLVHRLPFSSDRKLMTTVVKCPDPDSPHLYRVYVKGAAEVVLRLCRRRIDSSGKFRNMDTSHVDRVERQVIDPMTSQALRAICLAYKDFDPNELTDWKEPTSIEEHSFPQFPDVLSPGSRGRLSASSLGLPHEGANKGKRFLPKPIYKMETGLNCLGIAGMRDPVRDEVPAAVRRCQAAGIRVRMVTGDNIDTAKQIAIKCNIYHPETGGLAITGPEFYKLIGGVVCAACRTEICDCPTSSESASHSARQGQLDNKIGKSTSPSLPNPDKMEILSTSPTGIPQTVSSVVSNQSSDRRTQKSHVAIPVNSHATPFRIELTSSTPPQGHKAHGLTTLSGPRLQKPTEMLPTASTRDSATPEVTPSPYSRGCCSFLKTPSKVEKSRSDEREAFLSRKIRVDVVGDPVEFEKIAAHLEVLARSQPNDKYALVVGLKSLGSVVAVTGDGTNDAPALKKADVGFAMGIAGKEVAKQAADIVLLDDNFDSIVKAVKWGRNIYDNIRRFLQFQLTVNVVAVVTAFIGASILRSSPLNAVQLLWINLIMDTFASLALATEPPTESLLDRPPHSRSDYLVNKLMVRNILGQAIYQLTIMMALIFAGDQFIPERSSARYAQFEGQFGDFSEFSSYGDGRSFVTSGRRFFPFSSTEEYKREWTLHIGPSRHFTVVFNTFVWLQIFNMINSRKINDEWNVFSRALSNSMWCIIMFLIILGQVLLVQFGGYALECHLDGLTIQQWGICIFLGAGGLIIQLCLHIVPANQLVYIPQAGSKEIDLMSATTSLALASRGRMSTERLSSRLASGLHNEGRLRPSGSLLTRGILSPTGGGSGRLKSIHAYHTKSNPRLRISLSQEGATETAGYTRTQTTAL